jgi:hypothetical protein
MTDQRPRVEALRGDEAVEAERGSGSWYGTLAWAAKLASARLGSMEDARSCVQRIQAERDEVVRVTVLLWHLVYVDQPESRRALREYVDSDAMLPRLKPAAPGTLHAQYAVHVLAQCVGGFPVTAKFVGGYTDDDIRTARVWAASNLR